MRKYECYVCNKKINRKEAYSIKNRMDRLCDSLDPRKDRLCQCLTDNLDLSHCRGPPEQFFKDSGVVVCENCYEWAISKCMVKKSQPLMEWLKTHPIARGEEL